MDFLIKLLYTIYVFFASNMENLLISIVGGVVASVLCVSFAKLYGLNVKRKIEDMLYFIQSEYETLENALIFNNYNLAIQIASSIVRDLTQVNQDLRVLTFIGKKKRLFQTCRLNVESLCVQLLIKYRGYDSQETEYSTICDKILSYTKIGETDEDWVKINLQIMTELCSKKPTDAIEFVLREYDSNILNEIVVPVNFRGLKNWHKEAFSKEEYDKFVKKTIKGIEKKRKKK